MMHYFAAILWTFSTFYNIVLHVEDANVTNMCCIVGVICF